MKQTIILKGGVATTGTDPLVSDAELIERLEIAEEVLQLRDQVKEQRTTIDLLEQKVGAGVGQLDKLSLKDGDLIVLPEDIDNSAVQVLVNHVKDTLGIQNIGFVMGDIAALSDEDKAELVAEQIESKVAQTRAKLVEAMQENQHLHDYNKELQQGGDSLGKQLDHAKEDNRKLSINLVGEQRSNEALKGKINELEKQLKALKQHNPERLKKQVAELKKANKEKQASIESLRKQNHKFVKDNSEKAKTIAQMDIALEKACDDINQQNKPEPIDTINCGKLGKWNVYGTRQVNCYDVMDVKNDVSMRLHVENGQVICPEVRTPPKSLQQSIITRAARYVATEKKIEQDQKPLVEADK